MARKVVVELVDDIDGTVFGEDGESITFSVNGVDYEIDLKGKHASKFHKQIGFFIEHATPVGGRKRRSDRSVVSDAPVRRRGNGKEIRAWAAEQGYEISSRGRIPAEVEQAYQDPLNAKER
ncbi:histone-like nucleoid-structuring protein Lsr2 [Rhodococcus koreensis]|uniref:histone-like nucleoid-structuring protein Lsr2 n=1 Tax=Rhodococcus koreensis TaxID=99653 RepID=UPI001980DF8F|nr:Lsr2 family protein [Rhodococcus koreensis]QSE85573.1 Lsr2 family protein [Rhodococcus koreensis]